MKTRNKKPVTITIKNAEGQSYVVAKAYWVLAYKILNSEHALIREAIAIELMKARMNGIKTLAAQALKHGNTPIEYVRQLGIISQKPKLQIPIDIKRFAKKHKMSIREVYTLVQYM